MDPSQITTGKYAFNSRAYFNNTLVDPLAITLLIAMGVIMIVCNRKYAIWPMIVVASFITQAQRISIFTLDFTFIRIMVIFAFIRIISKNEMKGLVLNTVDKAVIAFMAVRIVWAGLKISKGGSVVGLLGETMDMWGMYFFFRCVIRDMEDVKNAAYGFILVSIPVAISFIVEHMTLRNPFYVFGGVSNITRERDGKLRCMGAYSHPILAGCFWAAICPFMGACIKWKRRIHIMPLIGLFCSAIIIILTASSTPVAAAGMAFIGGCLFPFRKKMKAIRWATAIILIAAQLIMAKGVAHILARTDFVGGSTGYYRFKLIDQFFGHFKDWAIRGGSAAGWSMPMFDIVNYYVWLGLAGGLIFVVLIIWLLVAGFKAAGNAIRSCAGDTEQELMAWAIGVSLFTHAMIFLAVTYYGQVIMIWYFSLAVCSARGSMGRRGFPMFSQRGAYDPLSRLATRPVAPYGRPLPIRM